MNKPKKPWIKNQIYQNIVDYKSLEQKILKTYRLDKKDLCLKSRKPNIVEARSLLCFWAVRKLGMTCTEVAKKLNLTQPAVSYATSRGEGIAKTQILDFEDNKWFE